MITFCPACRMSGQDDLYLRCIGLVERVIKLERELGEAKSQAAKVQGLEDEVKFLRAIIRELAP